MLNVISNNFSKSLFLLFISFFCSFNIQGQKHDKIWNELLNNNRSDALKLANKLKDKNDVEAFFLKNIVEMENGLMLCEPESLSKIEQYENYENYLFSNWMLPFLFNDYIGNGFDSLSLDAPHRFDTSKVSNSTLKNGLIYLQSVSKRYTNDWEGYHELMNSINAINDWEYCGVFENLNSSGIDITYPPENETSLSAVFDAEHKGKNWWYKLNNDNEVYQFYMNQLEYGSGVHYAQTFIVSDVAQKVQLKFGKGGMIRAWINDVLVVENDDEYITEMDAINYEVNLQKGVNRFLVKIASGSIPYFIMRLEDLNGNPVENIGVTFENREYIKSTKEIIAPQLLPHSVETYFEDLLKTSGNDKYLSRYCLFRTYLRNGKVEKALLLMNDWLSEFPNSSFLKSSLIECYDLNGESDSSKKLENNIKRQDPNYYLSLMLEFEKAGEIFELDMETFKNKLTQIGESVDYSYMKTATELFILVRENDRKKIREKLDILLNDPNLPSTSKTVFSDLYSAFLNDDEAAMKILEKFNNESFDFEITNYLSYYYKKQNRNEDAIKLYLDILENYKGDNNVYLKIINTLHEMGEFDRSLQYIDKALKNFPNSYLFTKLKADALVQLDKDDKAIELYELAYTRKPTDYSLRDKINDIQNKKNIIDEFHLKDAYSYINKNRGTIKENNYGINALIIQTDVLKYKNSGGEFRKTMIYEITSQNGIDIFKEYDLGLYGNYTVHKSEAVKESGDTVPAERSGSSLVFSDLKIGDVIYIEYTNHFNNRGRFYKDYILSNNFNTYHPSIKTVYRLLTFDKKVNHVINNGEVNYKSFKKQDMYVHEWSQENSKGIPISEDYMPTFSNVTTKLHISSIDSWSEIANWYSDLVRKQLKFDDVVQTAFTSIFPDGYKDLSETERAKKIYYYITDNFNYSYVDFRQSGFVPQKPSKTIKTKLGDCKDFSTLFLVLAQEAELDANLVLVLTSDYGKRDLILPSSEFNHCIIKVNIEGKEQFLELTSKHLLFRSLPMSLREATALEIPFNSSENNTSTLFHIENESRVLANFSSQYTMHITEDKPKVDITTTVSGHLATYYIDIFKNKTGTLLNEEVKSEFINRSSENVELLEIGAFNTDRELNQISFEAQLEIDSKVSKVANLFTFKIPYFTNPYNNSIIYIENRKFPINYINYENADSYNEEFLLKLDDDKSFIEIAENVSYQFKKHTFSIDYELVKKNELKIVINSNVDSETILPSDYKEFKEYVEKVLETRDRLIIFKVDTE